MEALELQAGDRFWSQGLGCPCRVVAVGPSELRFVSASETEPNIDTTIALDLVDRHLAAGRWRLLRTEAPETEVAGTPLKNTPRHVYEPVSTIELDDQQTAGLGPVERQVEPETSSAGEASDARPLRPERAGRGPSASPETAMGGADDAEVEAARRVSATYERRYHLERGSLLAIAWFGAREGARRSRAAGRTEPGGYLVRGAQFAVLTAIRDGELDGSRRLGDGRRLRLRSLQAELGRVSRVDDQESLSWQPAAPHGPDPAARLDAAALLEALRDRLGERSALILERVDAEGRSQREVADDLRISAVRVSQLRARALRLARQLVALDGRPDLRGHRGGAEAVPHDDGAHSGSRSNDDTADARRPRK